MGTRDSKQCMTRRDFLMRAGGAGSAALAAAGLSGKDHPGKTVLSFYVDDTNPYIAGVDAFAEFLDFAGEHGIAGESSMILGYGWEEHGLISRPKTGEQRAYIKQLQRAYECGIDSHMELMTHKGLFDFRAGRAPDRAQHEGVWLYEPDVSLDQYESYFAHIIEEGENIGVRFTGVTWPGCSCAVCTRRYAGLRRDGAIGENPNLWKALLKLARRGKFRGPTVPCFILGGTEEHPLKAMAAEGECGVYDLYPNAEDHFGIWENNPARVSADYYITADGESGRIVEKIRAGAPRCVFYAHWQGVNPANGNGWAAFKQVVARVRQHYADRVVWMRPSAVTESVISHQPSAISHRRTRTASSGRGSETSALTDHRR